MLSIGVMLMLGALQQQQPTGSGLSSPASGDTTGYWQQDIHYVITATLDEPGRRVRASGTLRYANNSPDTLREMYFHLYLNAFRPRSRWSETDEREGRVRFQRLADPDYAYERFTAPVRVDGQPVAVTYPGAPDSTVVRLTLPRPLPPGGSLVVSFEWDARPSTVPRRQARRGRHWDLAQWYPKVAVYDRGGWQHNALQPAGEFYGEFGTYDVTLVVAPDQVLAATGVPVSGDPGWGRVLRGGVERRAEGAYGRPADPRVVVPEGMKGVRFVARDVHHFAWSASPDFRYEGGVHVRPAPARFGTWDTVSIHVLYRPGDDTTWGGQRVVQRTIAAIQWLERIYGPYAYPQMTVMHRIDGGGTEFPMLQANGSPSQGLILHEGGHIWSYGILANNEWRSGWLDEGLTSYQTSWAQQLTPQERARAGLVDRFAPTTGYRARAARMRLPRFEAMNLGQVMTDLEGGAEPIGTTAHEFRDFGTYNEMIYTRAEVMYGQLRDAVGDTAFLGFLGDYYARWALRHVDERAMRASAERTSGRGLGWFFGQWVHRTGVMDYALGAVRTARQGDAWITEAEVVRRGEYHHPMTVGVRTASGWTVGRMIRPPFDREVVRIRTAQEPLEARLDPLHTSWDWDRRNDVRHGVNPLRAAGARVVFEWPFLDQTDRERDVVSFSPVGWYSSAGGVAIGFREKGSYLGLVDRTEGGLASYPDPSDTTISDLRRAQAWWRFSNLSLPWMRRPAIGWYGGLGHLDGVLRFELGRERSHAAGQASRVLNVAANYTRVVAEELMPELYSPGASAVDLGARLRWQRGLTGDRGYLFAQPSLLGGWFAEESYGKAELALGAVRTPGDRTRLGLRLYGGATTEQIPAQRALVVTTPDQVTTYWGHWRRPRGALLKRPGFNSVPLGGAAMRGFAPWIVTRSIAALNGDAAFRVGMLPRSRTLGIWAHAFGDAAQADGPGEMFDAGVGLSVRGRLFDRDILVRLDAPLYVNKPALTFPDDNAATFAPRWLLTFNDLW